MNHNNINHNNHITITSILLSGSVSVNYWNKHYNENRIYNPSICPASSFLERKAGNNKATTAISLLERDPSMYPMEKSQPAAVVCSLGEIYLSVGNTTTTARELDQSPWERSESESSATASAILVPFRRLPHHQQQQHQQPYDETTNNNNNNNTYNNNDNETSDTKSSKIVSKFM